MQKKINWGVLGTGNIAHIFARALANSETSQLYAVGSRNYLTANAFGMLYDAHKLYSSYESLLSDPEVQAVYIALPHSMHAEWTKKAAKAKKHILCEKPLTINYQESLLVVEAVRDNEVFLMEAFVFRSHPQTEKLRELIKSRIIGKISVINATFSFKSEDSHIDRRLLKDLGTGGILDVGCYPISMVRLIVGEALGVNSLEPEEIFGVSYLDDAGIDGCSVCCAKFSGEILAQVSCGISVSQDQGVKIYGSEGYILIKSPWIPGGRNPAITEIILYMYNNTDPKIFYIETKVGSSNFMIDDFVKSMSDRSSWASFSEEALMNMKTLDRWRASSNVNYEIDNKNL
jgi:predicted dehydrogenase|tara:strand:+ start:21535 stop:22569 length:1035 start_codon:yes stop_codon:yes gene_type:complete